MTDQTIPAEKVREALDKFERVARLLPSEPGRVAAEFSADIRALLPAQQPTTGLLGRWAHDGYGLVLVISDGVFDDGTVPVLLGGSDGTNPEHVPFDSLAFPHQATKPEDVPAGEAWLVDVEHSKESHKAIVALKDVFGYWRTSDEVTHCIFWEDKEVTLISPLTPERPGKDDLLWKYASLQQDYAHLEKECSDLQAKYDALDAKYREAQEKIKALEQALDNLRAVGGTWRVCDEPPKPAWRIAHDWRNLRVGEYIIDKDGDTGTVNNVSIWGCNTDGEAYGTSRYAPFIVFPNKGAATPEAIEEAKRARDKETGK